MQQNIKLYHWMTKTYSRHVAADKLYNDLLGKIDTLVETYIGKYGRPKLAKKDLAVTLENCTDSSILQYLDTCSNYLIKHIFEYINETDTDMVSMRDDILGLINQTRYLFSLSSA